MLKITIVGPESSGKTTLSKALAAHYRAGWVEEVARGYLNERNGMYGEEDLLRIAELQVERESHVEQEVRQAPERTGPPILFCDTDMITLRIWSEEKFGHCDARIMAFCEERRYDLWLLCGPDIPWEPDPLRENPHDRDRLFRIYEALLKGLDKPYAIMEGEPSERLRSAIALIDPLLERIR